MATAGAVIGGTADASVTVTASSFSAGLVSRTTDIPTVTTRTIITAMAIILTGTGTPLLMGTIMITLESQLTDMTIAIVIAEGRQSLRSSAKWLERATIMVPLTESWGQKPVVRSAPTNVRAAR